MSSCRRTASLLTVLPTVLLAVWLGAHLAIGYLAAPTLFNSLPREEAGRIAGLLFSRLDWLALLCLGGYTALCAVRQGKPFWQSWLARLALLLLACTLVQHLALQPMIADLKLQAAPEGGITHSEALRPAFARLHAISSILYLLQSLAGFALVALHARSPQPPHATARHD